MQTVDFLFEYEARNREFDSLCLVAAYLESKGYSVGFVNSWNSLFHTPLEYNAGVITISACYDDGTYDYFCSHAGGYEKVVDMQWEQLRSNKVDLPENRKTWGYSGVALETRHICWGEREKQYLKQQFGIDDVFLGKCGYIPLDFYRPEFRSLSLKRDVLFKKYGLDAGKKTLLFVSSFASVGLPKAEEGNVDNEEIQLSYTSQEIILGWFIKLAQNDPDIQIIYRPHPAEVDNPQLQKYADEISNFFVLTQESIRHWIINCDVLYNWQSTSMVEMYTSGKSVYLLRPVEIPPVFDIPIFENVEYHVISTYEAFRASTVADHMEMFPISVDDLLSYYDIQEKPTCQRVGDYLIETLRDDSYHSRPVGRTVFSTRSRLGRIRRKLRVASVSAVCNGKKIPSAWKGRLEEENDHFDYYRQKIKLNSIPEKEIRKQINLYRSVFEKKN